MGSMVRKNLDASLEMTIGGGRLADYKGASFDRTGQPRLEANPESIK